jgi:very-short-patch-repair endonuclease
MHHPGTVERGWHRGLPVTPVSQTLLDIAPMVLFAGLRRALAVADHEGLISHAELDETAESRRRGARAVRKAYAVHMPELAKTRSTLEDRFLFFCERQKIELPHPNFVIAGYEVDAVWPHLKLAVELDGREEHGTPGAVVVDRRRELAIRGAGYEVIRYGSEQIDHQAEATARDLLSAIARQRD